jgi:dephospho-CoA kinase
MLKIGLTGSIAVGKSFVCEVFRELGVSVLDADQTAREVVLPNTKGWRKIVEEFGREILLETGEIDRVKLGGIVFNSEEKRKLLNSIVHPLVFEAQDQWLSALDKQNEAKFAIIDAALMIESGSYQRFDKIIVVWCKPNVQLQRLMDRNGLSETEALKRINAQMSQTEKKKFADYLIDTSEGFEATRKQVVEIFELLSVYKRNEKNKRK